MPTARIVKFSYWSLMIKDDGREWEHADRFSTLEDAERKLSQLVRDKYVEEKNA